MYADADGDALCTCACRAKAINAVTLDYIDSKELIQSLAGSDIKCGLIYSGNGKCLWLLYREQQVNQYLMDPENQRF